MHPETNQLVSPDLPAYVCYLIVLVVGISAAASLINRLLDSSTGRWGFLSTWFVFLAHVGVPIALFWFLDYTNALHDTSLFAALTVAVGYRQIFAGGVQGILMPGQTPALWKPFEAWVTLVSERIRLKNILWRDRFNEKLKNYLSAEAARLDSLREFVFKYSKNTAQLEAALKALAAQPQPSTIPAQAWNKVQASNETKFLIQELRTAIPENYGYFLLKDGLLSWWQYGWWLGNARAKFTAWAVGVLLLLSIILACVSFKHSQYVQFHYYQWRFAKSNATEQDSFRTREFLRATFGQSTNATEQTRMLLEPLLKHLRYEQVPSNLAKNIIQLIMIVHSHSLDEVIVPQLLEALRTKNTDVRLSIHQTLKDLQATDYPSTTLGTNLLSWQPEHEAPEGDIDSRARAWQKWWQEAKK